MLSKIQIIFWASTYVDFINLESSQTKPNQITACKRYKPVIWNWQMNEFLDFLSWSSQYPSFLKLMAIAISWSSLLLGSPSPQDSYSHFVRPSTHVHLFLSLYPPIQADFGFSPLSRVARKSLVFQSLAMARSPSCSWHFSLASSHVASSLMNW